MGNPDLIGILYKHDNDDYELWFHNLPKDDLQLIEKILEKHAMTGYSVRGAADDVGKEL